ncbi:MAG: flagellar hook-length control protein FliK [Pseudomonadales bacterium]|nr:flagellar hook-length control protein FliK [Pseudomonadales bacterium]
MLSLPQQLLDTGIDLNNVSARLSPDASAATTQEAELNSFAQELSRLLQEDPKGPQTAVLKEFIGSTQEAVEAVSQPLPSLELHTSNKGHEPTAPNVSTLLQPDPRPLDSFPPLANPTSNTLKPDAAVTTGNVAPESGKDLPPLAAQKLQFPQITLNRAPGSEENEGFVMKQPVVETGMAALAHPDQAKFRSVLAQPHLTKVAEFSQQETGTRFQAEELADFIELSNLSGNKSVNERGMSTLDNQVQAKLQFSALTAATSLSAEPMSSGSQSMTPVQAGSDIAVKLQQFMDTAATQENLRANSGTTEAVLREQVTTAYGNPRWFNDFAGRIRVIANANVPVAELSLNPAELGAIEIKIHAQDDGTIINFFSSNPATRELIDTSLPRLRDLLADSGIQLQHGDVSDRKPGANDSQTTSRQWSQAKAAQLEVPVPELPAVPRPVGTSMIDHYV